MQELKRKYQKHMIVTSGIIVVMIFFAGMLFGMFLDQYRVKEMTSIFRQNELDTESYVAEQGFFNSFGSSDCQLLKTSIIHLSDSMGNIGQKLELYGSKSTFETEEFEYLKRKYFISEVKLYSDINNYKKQCSSNYDVILFFYKINDETSIRQGYILDDIYAERKEKLTILSFDIDYNKDPLLDIIKLKYNITASPAVIVNNNDIFQGKLAGRAEIVQKIS